MENLIKTIAKNQSKIKSYGKLDLETLKIINYKFRLDWNYYSNRMEGGTLTNAETRSVMVQNIDVKGKPFKDVAEMQGHDTIILEILKIGKGELRISEKRIKEIHKAIMFENEPKKAKQIGIWKNEPNEIINYRDEKIGFTPPNEVVEEIHILLNKTNAELDKYFVGKSNKNVIEIASDFHINFLTIHPFYDGNGRVARILTNLILISCAYPVIIIKEKEKKVYYNLLADIQCYGGKQDLLESFFAKRLIESQQLVIDAIEGKDIDEDDDLDKRINLFRKEYDVIDKNKEIDEKLNLKVYYKMFNNWIRPLLDELIKTTIKFNDFYTEPNHKISLKLDEEKYFESFIQEPNYETFPNYNFLNDIDNEFDDNLSEGFLKQINEGRLVFSTFFGTFKKGGTNSKGCVYRMYIEFELFNYNIKVEYFDSIKKDRLVKVFEKHLLHQGLSDKKIKEINKMWGDSLFQHLDHIMKNSENETK